MLRATRRPGQRLRIGDDIVVEVIEFTGNAVRLGVEAPQSVRIYREELWLEIKRENEEAAEADAPLRPSPPHPD